ncbi:MAG: hypothetical protein WC548_00745 [Candidatus Pacearchaeota archaeon]
MAIFKKEKVPEIPMAPSLPDFSNKKDLPELPSFPSNLKNNNLNQEIVKSAISDNFSPEENEVKIEEDLPEESTIEMFPPISSASSSIPLLPGKQSIIEEGKSSSLPQTQHVKSTIPNRTFSAKTPAIRTHSIPSAKDRIESDVEPIFIRIDKFQLAKKNIEQIKDKVEEMESVIGKIKQIKIKEEEEIKSWSEEIENLKVRISEIDSNVFNQI